MKKHVDAGGRTLTVVPGDGYYSLTGKTSCTYLHDEDGWVSAVLLETASGEEVVEAAEFLCQQVVFAQSPSATMAELGIKGIQGQRLALITSFDGVSAGQSLFIRNRLLSLSAKSLDMGHVSEWPKAVVEAMIK